MTRRLERIAERAAYLAFRKAKRLGYQIYFIDGDTDLGVLVWCLRDQFTKGTALLDYGVDVEQANYYIPRQYNENGSLIFPTSDIIHTKRIANNSRIYDPKDNKLYSVDRANGDVEGMTNTSVFMLECTHRNYNPFFGDWSPGSDNVVAGIPSMTWHDIEFDTTAIAFHGYFIRAISNPVTLTLPANPYKGYTVAVRLINSTQTVTINPYGTNKIEGSTTLTITAPALNSSFWMIYDDEDSSWRIVSEIN